MRAALTLRSEMAELPRLTTFAGEFAQRAELTDGERNRLMIIIDELFSNIVRYGYDGPETHGTIIVRLSLTRDRLGIDVTDDGRPFDPLAAPAPDLELPTAERPVGGLGIYFVRKLVDEARYFRRGKHNRLVLTRRIDARTRA